MEEVWITEESEYFPPPRELRELLTAISTAAAATLAAPVAAAALTDRALAASAVLTMLDA